MNKLIMVILPVLLVAGSGTYFAASKGMVNIPGITPKKKPQAKTEVTIAEEPLKKTAAPKVTVPVASLDEEAGQNTLASIWSNLEPDQLALITEKWSPKDLSPILLKMEPKKVTMYLAELKPARASDVSRDLQRRASVIVD